MTTKECLSRGQLKEYLSGWVDVVATERIEAHLANCSDCEQTIVSLEADPDTLLELATPSTKSSASAHPSQNVDSPVAQALRAAKLYTPARENTTTTAKSTWPHVGQDVAGYELLRPLGRGGMGTVYVAKHTKLGKEVAIKLLPNEAFRDPSFADRFQREIRAAGGLEHTSIVRATDAGEAAGVHYLVMELVDGLDLSRIVRLADRLDIADACEIGRQIALGLSYAHAAGIVHRDVKPSNIVLARDGTAKLLDFGLARTTLWDEVSVELTTVGQLMGTIDYMAPEQAERPESVDYRADLYALGATLFRLLAGRTPLSIAPSLSPLAKLRLLAMHEPPLIHTLRDDVPSELVKLISELLARNPDARPPSADHVAERLSRLGQDSDLPRLVELAIEKADDELDLEGTPEREHQFCTANETGTKIPDATTSKTNVRRSSIGAWLLTGLATLGLLAAGVIFTLETQKGQLVVESDVPGVTVQIKQNGKVARELKIENAAQSTRLWAGQYEVVLSAGSDSVEIADRTVVVLRGETQIARVRLAAEEDSTAVALPGASAELQPGDRLRSAWLSNTELNHKTTITADRTIKLPMIGTVSVAGLNLEQLEMEIRGRYGRHINNPNVEVFRDVSPEITANELTAAMRGVVVPPASTAPLQPGDALFVSSLNDNDIACRVLVQADYTIKPILIGTVSVQGKTVDQLEEELAFRYSKYMKNPSIQLFRDFTSPGPTWAAASNSAAIAPETASEPSVNEPMYDSRTLSQWLELLRRERSPEALHDVFEALDALASKSTAERITTEILQVIPHRNGSTLVRKDNSRTTLDDRAFPLLQESNPGKAYFDLLRDQLSSTEDLAWKQRIVDGGLLFRYAKASDMANLNDWLVKNVFLPDGDDELRRSAMIGYRMNARSSLQNEEVAELLVESISTATGDTNTFWLEEYPLGSSSRRSGGATLQLPTIRLDRHPSWCREVAKRAVSLLQSHDSPRDQLIQAERILYLLFCADSDAELGINSKLVAELVVNRSKTLSDDLLLGTTKLPAVFRNRYRVSASHLSMGAFQVKLAESKMNGADVEALALIDLAHATLKHDDNQQYLNDLLVGIENVIFDLNHAASPNLPQLSSRRTQFALEFPNFEDTRNERPYATPERWTALLIACRIYDGLDQESRNAFTERMAGAQRQRWFASMSGTGTGAPKPTAITFERARQLLNIESQPAVLSAKWEEQVSRYDENKDTKLDAAELARLYTDLSSLFGWITSAHRDWSRRMIGKYDTNEDGVLAPDEWNKMLIKPTKADYNKDGTITVDEYARLRAQQ